ncbi:MAG: aminopeptidase P family protein [Methanobacterium sp.]|uniref:M24 family metallopeptidase n=1 Tax=Methanobacterium sp. TaxID=2164 RepID=UPI003D652086|nr:aminopeptidase P family protein [Methanobacterium sp.]
MKIIDEMHKERLDSILILNPINITYLCGFKPSSPSILMVKDETVLFTSKMDIEGAIINSKIPVEDFKSLDEIKNLLKGTIGIEGSMTLETFERLKKGSSFKTKITNIPERLRRVKSNDELKNIKKAIDIAENSMNKIELKESMSENELAAQIEYKMRINGSNKAAFDTIVASDTRSSLPHAEASNNPLKNPVVIDWGAVYNNYCSDTTRTIIETEKHEEIFEIVLEAQKKAIDVIKPGIKVSYVDKVARDVIEEYGYGDSFIHSTGHGVGLEVHESPSLSKRYETKLEKGMVITVEPGIYLKDEFGVRIEDMVQVKNKGRVLNKIKKKI